MSRGKNRPASKRAKLDQYWTPQALADACVAKLPIQPGDVCLEPHVGGGAFAVAMRKAGASWVTGWDLDPSVPGRADCDAFVCRDALSSKAAPAYSWVVGNPPFLNAAEQVEALFKRTRHLAFLAPLALQEGGGRAAFWSRMGRHLRGYWVLAQRADFLRVGGLAKKQAGLFAEDVVVEDDGDGFNTPLAFYWWDSQHSGSPEFFCPGWDWKG